MFSFSIFEMPLYHFLLKLPASTSYTTPSTSLKQLWCNGARLAANGPNDAAGHPTNLEISIVYLTLKTSGFICYRWWFSRFLPSFISFPIWPAVPSVINSEDLNLRYPCLQNVPFPTSSNQKSVLV